MFYDSYQLSVLLRQRRPLLPSISVESDLHAIWYTLLHLAKKNVSSSHHIQRDIRTDRHDEANSRFSQF
jgi:hypothetical protein